MGTEVRAVEVRAPSSREQLAEAALHGVVLGDRIETACDTGLIRDDDDEKTVVIQLPDRCRCPGEQLDLVRLVQKPGILDDGAVAVEKDCPGRQPSAFSAAMTSSTCSGKMVLASSSTRLPATRAMIGGSLARSRSASSSSGNPTSHVLSFAPGNDPPPTSESPSISSAWPPTPCFNAVARLFTPSGSSVSIRSTGISRRAVSESRYKASVASTAARVSLSARTVRAMGSPRHAAIAASLPTRIPACGPPSSLSPLKAIKSAPVATASGTVG